MPQNNKVEGMTQKLAIWHRKEKFVFNWNLKCCRPMCHILKGFDRPLISTAAVPFPTMYPLSYDCRPFLFQCGQHIWFAVWIWGRSYERVTVVWTMPVVWRINIWCSFARICCTEAHVVGGRGRGWQHSLSVEGLTQAAAQPSFKSSCLCTDFILLLLSHRNLCHNHLLTIANRVVHSWLMLLFM